MGSSVSQAVDQVSFGFKGGKPSDLEFVGAFIQSVGFDKV
jgi:hypothetical protein